MESQALNAWNPLRTFTAVEVAELMHCDRKNVKRWEDVGFLKGIKSGKGTVYTQPELERFQHWALGKDISNLVKITEVAEREKKCRKDYLTGS